MKLYYLPLFLVFIPFFSSAQCDRHRDSLALVSFYNGTNGLNWTNQWDLNERLDYWHGLRLNDAGCVQELELINNNLSGSIPPEFYELLELEHLNLSSNQLSGTLSSQIEALSNLNFLALEDNQLSGEIIPEIGKLSRLRVLDLSINHFSGEIPSELGELSSLRYLRIRHNDFFDENFPKVFLELDSIIAINIEGNGFIGSIPEELGDLEFLHSLSVSLNLMSGCFPEFVCSLVQFDASLNSAMPWEGDHRPLCNGGLEQIGAECNDIMTSEPTEIDENCECAILSSNDELDVPDYKIYPNPFVDELYVDLANHSTSELEVYDLLGNLVHSQMLVYGKNKILWEEQVQGAYFLSIDDGNRQMVMKY